MPIKVTKTLSLPLESFGREAGRGLSEALRKARREMAEPMAMRLEAHLIHDVIGQQQSPDGNKWTPLKPLSRLLRQADGRGNTKLATGPRNAMIRSLQVGNSENILDVTDDGFTYGSKLERGLKTRVNVVEAFQSPNRVPKDGGDNSDPESPRRKVQRYMGWRVGWHAPGNKGHLTRPTRILMGVAPEWVDELMEIALPVTQTAVDGLLAAAMKQAGMEVAAVRSRRPDLAGGVQLF